MLNNGLSNEIIKMFDYIEYYLNDQLSQVEFYAELVKMEEYAKEQRLLAFRHRHGMPYFKSELIVALDAVLSITALARFCFYGHEIDYLFAVEMAKSYSDFIKSNQFLNKVEALAKKVEYKC